MRLTWKDGAATALTAGAVALYASYLAEGGLPLVSGPRVAAVTILVVGLVACALGGSAAPEGPGGRSVGVTLLGWLGGLALLAGLAAVITGSDVALAILVATTVALWFAATARHLLTRGTGEVKPHQLQQS